MFVRLSSSSSCPAKFKRTVWHYTMAYFDSVSDELFSSLPTINDTDDIILSSPTHWKHTFLSSMEKISPHGKAIKCKSLPWITRDLLNLFSKCRRCHSKAKVINTQSMWVSYKKARNKAVSALRPAKSGFLQSLSSRVKTPRLFWSACNSFFPIISVSQLFFQVGL